MLPQPGAGEVAFPGIQHEASGFPAASTATLDAAAVDKEVFVEGVPVGLAVGLAVGPDDDLYVSTQWIRSVLVLDTDTGEIIKRIGPEEGVDIPADLTFGPDGSLYVGMYPGFEGDAVMRLVPTERSQVWRCRPSSGRSWLPRMDGSLPACSTRTT